LSPTLVGARKVRRYNTDYRAETTHKVNAATAQD